MTREQIRALEREYTLHCLEGCDRCVRETGYNPTGFRAMVQKRGGSMGASIRKGSFGCGS
jgi:hypothetical protein